jgi:dipeptidyl aminopeptidase/acylaminoacyl peptidase
MRVALCLLMLATTIRTQGIVVDRRPYEIPAYESVKGVERYASRDEYETAARDGRFRLEKLTYLSGPLQVFAYLYAPVRSAGAQPAVVFNRGSFVRGEFAAELLATFHRLAEAGFVVLAPMYRQSGGAEGRDEMGGADLADLMATVGVAQALGVIDARNLFMYGESRGGMMTYQAIRDGYPLRAAAVYGAFTDLRALLESSPQARAAAPTIWPGYPANADAIHQRRSALMWPEQLHTPLLILHGGNDRDVSPSQSLALAARLEQLGKPYELVVRAGANHTLANWRVERDAHVVGWFRRHLPPASPQP